MPGIWFTSVGVHSVDDDLLSAAKHLNFMTAAVLRGEADTLLAERLICAKQNRSLGCFAEPRQQRSLVTVQFAYQLAHRVGGFGIPDVNIKRRRALGQNS